MNLKRRAKSTSFDRAASRQTKIYNGLPLTLEERRAEQEATIKEQFQGSKDVTLKTENWFKILGQHQSSVDFKKLGYPICDAIIIPEVPLIFGTDEDLYSRMKVFLLDFKIPVKYVGKAVRDGCVFIQLQDNDNKFTVELLEKLRTALDALRKAVKATHKRQKETKEEECNEQEFENIYIKQIDYTQDLVGFFMSLTPNIFDDLKEFSKLLGMEYSREYTQLRTSFQFEEKCLVDSCKPVTINRLKIYNKLVHLWTSGQFKKWLNMNTHKIFKADQAFYFDKILPGMIEGLSRIEHSLYFHKKADQDEMLFDTKQDFTTKLIDPVMAALNKKKDNFRYDISFPIFVESYFRATATKSVLISFEENLWAIAYSYSERAYCFTGHLVNRTKHSGNMLDFIKRYVPEGANMRIFIKGKVYDNIKKRGTFLQLPISSLNAQHTEQYNFKLSSNYKYSLSKDEITSIQIVCEDEELLYILGIVKQAPMNKREQKRQEKQKREDGGTLVEHLLEQKRDNNKSKRYFCFKAPSSKQCKFYVEDTRGRTYICEHCNSQLQRRGQGKGQLYLM